MPRTNKHNKVFERLSTRFKDRIRSSASDEEAKSVDCFLRQAFTSSPLRYSQPYNQWLFNSTQENRRYIAWDGNNVIGTQYGLNGTVNTPHRVLKTCCAIDLSVTEQWRMKGLGVALIKRLMDEHDLVIGLGISQAAQAMFTRLDWHNLGQVTCYIKPLTSKGFSNVKQNQSVKSSIIYRFVAWGVRFATRLKYIFSSKRTIIPLSKALNYTKELDDLFTEYDDTESTYRLKKDSKYFQWRYLKAPSSSPYDIHFLYQNGKLSSYLVTMIGNWHGKQVLAICDYFGAESDYPELINLSEKLALSAEVDAIMYQGLNSGFEQKLKKSFFVKRPHGDLFMLYSDCETVNSEKVLQAKNWRITFSDSDMDFMFFQS